MNKRAFYKRLAEKYDLPLEYIRFKLHMEWKQKAIYESIFYGM